MSRVTDALKNLGIKCTSLNNIDGKDIAEVIECIADHYNSSGGGGGGDPFAANGITVIEGTEATIEPYKYTVVNMSKNSIKLTFANAASGYLPYKFELGTNQVDPLVTITTEGFEFPLDFKMVEYTRYLFDVINGKITCKGSFSNYPYSFIFGNWASSDWTNAILFKSDHINCVYSYTENGESKTKNAKYQVEKTTTEGNYLVILTFEDETMLMLNCVGNTLTSSDGTIVLTYAD